MWPPRGSPNLSTLSCACLPFRKRSFSRSERSRRSFKHILISCAFGKESIAQSKVGGSASLEREKVETKFVMSTPTLPGAISGHEGGVSSRTSSGTVSTSGKNSKVPKLALEMATEGDGNANANLTSDRSLPASASSQAAPSRPKTTQLMAVDSVHASTSSKTCDGGGTSASISVRVFVTSDLTPHRFCAVVVKPGWQWDDFLEAASAKLSGGAGGGLTNISGRNSSISAANAVFLHNGAEIGTLDDLRESDQILLRFQKRLSMAPGLALLLNANGGLQSRQEESSSLQVHSRNASDDDTELISLPKDGVFRILTPELRDVSPLSLSDELVADLVQDELKLLSQDEAYNGKSPERCSVRVLFRNFLLGNDALTEALLRTYDYLLPHHSFLAILVVHLRAPLVPMEAGNQQTGVVRPQPPASRSNALLPTYGMSITMTDPIRRGSAQTRLVNILRQWLEIRYETVREDLAALELLDDLIVYLCASPERLRAYGELIAQTFKVARKSHLNRERDLELCAQTLLPRDKISFSRAVEVTPFELACQLTLADQDIFLRVNVSELQALQFDLPERVLSPNIIEWVKHSSFITLWVVASILGPPGEPNPGPKKRAAVLQHFIVAMDELRSLKSFNSMMQIYHALVHPAIDRLEATWALVSAAHKSILSSVSDAIKPPSSLGYLNMLSSSEAPAIPYIEYHLNELRYIETSETSSPNGEINFAKFERLAKAFKQVIRLQRNSYQLVPNAAYMSFIRSYEVPTVSTLIELSLALEPEPAGASGANSASSVSAAAHLAQHSLAAGSYPSSSSNNMLSQGSSSTSSSSSKDGKSAAKMAGRSATISGPSGPTTSSHHFSSSSDANSGNAGSSGAAGVPVSARSSSTVGNASAFGSNASSTSTSATNTSQSGSGKDALAQNSSPASASASAGSSGAGTGATPVKERKRKESVTNKLVKEKEKEEEKRRKKWDKQAKKIRPLLTAALAVEQAVLNNDIYEQFLSYSDEPSFTNALVFFKMVADFKRMFGSDAEPAARRTREEASRIASTYLIIGGDKTPDFSLSLEPQVKEISNKAKGEQNLFTNNLFDPLVADLAKLLNTSFVLFKAQRTS